MHTAKTHTFLGGLLVAALVVLLAPPGAAAVKKIAYPEVKVTLNKPYKPDAAFEKMHAAFLDAVKRKDAQAITALVAPTFLWTVGDQPADELDLGRDSVHNFKVAFGFRALGKDVDGGVDGGPYWEVLAAFADDATYYAATDSGNLVCGPISAEVADEKVPFRGAAAVGPDRLGAGRRGATPQHRPSLLCQDPERRLEDRRHRSGEPVETARVRTVTKTSESVCM
jgi:hypothetical protein